MKQTYIDISKIMKALSDPKRLPSHSRLFPTT